ncbi:MAG TPA: hypothetical protein HA255_03140 [Methanosphaera sp.]|nr:hypothetical protein [Methanosphaera sp.]
MVSVYLKFVQRKEYATDLLNSKFFCQTPEHYRNYEDQRYGRGDPTEGNIMGTTAIYLKSTMNNFFIYCMMRLDDTYISNGKIVIPQDHYHRMVKEFDSSYAVVINGPTLENILALHPFDHHIICQCDDITYKNLSVRDTFSLLKNSQVGNGNIC